MTEQVLFVVLATVALAGAVGVVASRTVVMSALSLILSFVGVAGLYVLLQAGFLAMIQVLIYVGAISVLILFTIMLTRQVMSAGPQSNAQWYLAVIVAVILFGTLGAIGYATDWPVTSGRVLPAAGGSGVIGPVTESNAIAPGDAAAIPGAVVTTSDTGAKVVQVPGPIVMLGVSLMTSHLLSFELISAILLVALMGAVIIARE